MKIAIAWHHEDGIKEYWDTPRGISIAFEKLGHEIGEYGFDPKNCDLSRLIKDVENYDFILIMYAGGSDTLDSEIKKLRKLTKKKILIEMGDEPQTNGSNQVRLQYADAIFTPDLRCQKNYISRGINSYWLTHWGDEFMFDYDETIPRQNRCVTTCGQRYGTDYIKSNLGDYFLNERIPVEENKKFYNSGTVSFQFANFDEITRRVMEAGGCKLAMVTNAISPETGIYDIFKHEEDILYYRDPNEAINCISRLLSDHNLREKLANNLYDKINKFHRSKIRCEQLLKIFNNLK